MLLSSAESKWAMEFQPPLALAGTAAPDRGSYERIFDSFYRSLFEAGLQAGICTVQQFPDDPADLAARWPVIVVPGLYIAREAELQYLARYAEAGGHLVLGFRSGYADEHARPRPVLMPGVLRAAVGASYNEYTNLGQPLPVVAEGGFECDSAAAATAWLDGVVAEDARVLARYVHPFYGRWAAITTNEVGSGRVTYVGTLPNAELGRSLARWLRTASLPADAWHDRPESVTATSGRCRDGTRLWFLSNWSWDRAEIPAAVAGRDILAGTAFGTGARLELGPWDVRVLAEQRADA